MSTETNNIEVCIHCENPTSHSICSSVECDKCDMSVETKMVEKKKDKLWDMVYPKIKG